jgi:hypothetical protein
MPSEVLRGVIIVNHQIRRSGIMKWLGVIAALVMAGAAYGIGPIGIGGYHILGIPIGESTITEATASLPGGSVTMTYDMTDGYSWKIGPANFGFGTIVYVWGNHLAAEGGFELHTGYKSKKATIKGTLTALGITGPFQWPVDEDNVTWKMMNIYSGTRYAYQATPGFWILGRGGLVYSLNSKLEYDTKWHGVPTTGVSTKGTHLGVYFGSGLNWFVTPKIAVTGLYTYNMLFEGTYDYSGLPGDYEEKWKPAPYVTLAHGVEFYF